MIKNRVFIRKISILKYPKTNKRMKIIPYLINFQFLFLEQISFYLIDLIKNYLIKVFKV